MDYDAFLGFAFQVATTFLIVFCMYRSVRPAHRESAYLYFLGLTVVVAIQLGFNTLDQYTWPLVATFQYLYFLGLVVYLLVDSCIRSPSPARFMMMVAVALLLMVANASYGSIFLLSMIGALILVYLRDRGRIYAGIALLLGGVWAGYYLWLSIITPEIYYAPTQSMMDVLQTYIGKPISVVSQFALAILAGLVNAPAVREMLPSAELLAILAAWVLMLSVIAVFVIYISKRLYQQTILPLALMLISVVFAGPVLITRFIWIANDLWGLTKPHYATMFKLVVVGALWALLLIIASSAQPATARSRRVTVPVATFVAIAVLVMQVLQIYSGWQKSSELALQNRKDELAIFHAAGRPRNTTDLPFRVTGFNKVGEPLRFLDRHNLNVFADNFPGEPAVREQVQARRRFRTSKSVVATVPLNEVDFSANEGEVMPYVSWSIKREGITVVSQAAEPLFLRVTIDSSKYLKAGVSFLVPDARMAPAPVDLLRGQQDLYFLLEDRATVTIATREPATAVEIELRR